MPEVTGIVERIYDNDTRVGKTYSLLVNGEKYGTYKTYPPCNEGDTVAFQFTTKGQYHNIDMKTLSTVTGAPQAGQPGNGMDRVEAASHAAAAPSPNGRQASIVWQHSQEMALRFAAIAQEAGALDLGTKGGKEGKLEALDIWVNAKTAGFFDDAITAAETGENPFLAGE